MKFEDCKNFSFDSIVLLRDKAKKGDKQAIKDFVVYSVYRSIDRNYDIGSDKKKEIFERLIKQVYIKVATNG